jgi:hypothetical protein
MPSPFQSIRAPDQRLNGISVVGNNPTVYVEAYLPLAWAIWPKRPIYPACRRPCRSRQQRGIYAATS